jgi:hypothetical protein
MVVVAVVMMSKKGMIWSGPLTVGGGRSDGSDA